MRTILATALCAVGLIGCSEATAPAWTDVPQFARGGGGARFSGESADFTAYGLRISFDIVGHGGALTEVTASALTTRVLECRDPDGYLFVHAEETETVSTTGTFGGKGKIEGSLTLSAPVVPVRCSAYATVTITSSYTNVQLTSPTAGTATIPGTFSAP